jgi:hypothetical protein
MRRLLLALAFLGAFGCASMATRVNTDLQKFAAFTRADLAAALADAVRVGDQTGVQCWTQWLTLLDSAQAKQLAQVPVIQGVFTTIQAGRDLKMQSAGVAQASEAINRACAAMVIDAATTISHLAAQVAPLLSRDDPALPDKRRLAAIARRPER